ncbi:MAG: pyridoxamine 5'-phosphate oxidase family protein [Acidobacteriota bacterium]
MRSRYHSGELEVQKRAGVRSIASRMENGIHSTIPLIAQEFLRNQPMAILATLDKSGRVWASLLIGEPGFMQIIDERTVRINATPITGDPLIENLKVGNDVGMLVIEFATRRRMRLNGKVEMRPDGIYINTMQVYANCPKYIQAREWKESAYQRCATTSIKQNRLLTAEQKHLITEADTFFIASFHQEGGADASHRGGYPGFVRISNENLLIWPDYSGNGMFQTLGNISANPNCGLLFIDFEYGNTLQITGRAKIVWDKERASEIVGAERLVEFQIEQVIEIEGANLLGWRFIDYSKFNPA